MSVKSFFSSTIMPLLRDKFINNFNYSALYMVKIIEQIDPICNALKFKEVYNY